MTRNVGDYGSTQEDVGQEELHVPDSFVEDEINIFDRFVVLVLLIIIQKLIFKRTKFERGK